MTSNVRQSTSIVRAFDQEKAAHYRVESVNMSNVCLNKFSAANLGDRYSKDRETMEY